MIGPLYIRYGKLKSDGEADAFKPLLRVLIDALLLALLDERFAEFPSRVEKTGLQFVKMLPHGGDRVLKFRKRILRNG